jgi:CheY-like chemotaxis protein
MTANARQSDRELCLAAGMVDFITKPIEPDELWRALLRWIPSRGEAGAPPARGGRSRGGLVGSAVLQIPGLDVGKACAGPSATFRCTCRCCAVRGSGSAAGREMQALVQGQDWSAAEMLAHTLKGVAGNIGAHALQAQAARLEEACCAMRTGAAGPGRAGRAGRPAGRADCRHRGQLAPQPRPPWPRQRAAPSAAPARGLAGRPGARAPREPTGPSARWCWWWTTRPRTCR